LETGPQILKSGPDLATENIGLYRTIERAWWPDVDSCRHIWSSANWSYRHCALSCRLRSDAELFLWTGKLIMLRQVGLEHQLDTLILELLLAEMESFNNYVEY